MEDNQNHKEYIKNIHKYGTFGGSAQVFAAAIMYGAKFEVFDHHYDHPIVIPSPEGNCGKKYIMDDTFLLSLRRL